jgi:hypothetical protein
MPRDQIGTDSYECSEFPLLAPGGHYIVAFTPSVVVQQTTQNTDILLACKAFPIDANGVVQLQERGDPTEPGGGALTQHITMPLSQLQEQVASRK